MTEPRQTERPEVLDEPTFKALFEVLSENAERFTTANTALRHADGNKDELVEDFVKNSDDEKARLFRERIAELIEAQYQHAESQVQVPTALSEEEKTRYAEDVKDARTKFKTAQKFLLDIAAMTGNTDAVKEGLDFVGDPTRGAVSTGSGLPKLSCTVLVRTGNGTETTFEKLSDASKFTGVPVSALLEQVASAGNVEVRNVSSLPVGQGITFELATKNGQVTVTVTPKERAKPGRKPAQEPASEDNVTRSDEDTPDAA